jgi:hypothetical protein
VYFARSREDRVDETVTDVRNWPVRKMDGWFVSCSWRKRFVVKVKCEVRGDVKRSAVRQCRANSQNTTTTVRGFE